MLEVAEKIAHAVGRPELGAELTGRYRVGVDFMRRCARGTDRVRYELVAEIPGRPPVRRPKRCLTLTLRQAPRSSPSHSRGRTR